MRKEARTIDQVSINRVNAYHRGNGTASNYAYDGFREMLLFASDRGIKLHEKAYHGFYWLYKPDETPALGFGLEIETECEPIHNDTVLAEVLTKIIFPHFAKNLFKLQHDGSLDGNSSAECITQIMTKAFIRNNYKNFKLMFDTYFPAFGISCDSGNCGMHCNISNGLFGKTAETQANNIRKLYYFINKHFNFCCKLFYRTSTDTTYFARQRNYTHARDLDLTRFDSDHYTCFNLGHYNEGRIELRIVGGQKNYACFRNTMESIFHLIHAVNTLDWDDLDDLTKVFKGCNQYVFDRLKTYCFQAGTISSTDLDVIRPTVKTEGLL